MNRGLEELAHHLARLLHLVLPPSSRPEVDTSASASAVTAQSKGRGVAGSQLDEHISHATMASDREEKKKRRRVPVILLSGFLGVGKTTLLRSLLQKTKKKVACIVNDVAAVNIDSRLVRSEERKGTTADLVDTIELQNGCLCCSLSDELFVSLQKIIVRSKKKRAKYDVIVVENSGVAEPSNIRDQFQEAKLTNHPLLEYIYLKTMVTVVDSCSFFEEYYSRDTILDRPLLGQGNNLPIVELLIEQVECSDVIVLNKSDLMAAEEKANASNEGLRAMMSMDRLKEVAHTLNPMAKILVSTNGEIDFEAHLFSGDDKELALMSQITLEGQLKGAVTAAKGSHHHHEHDHDHHHDHDHVCDESCDHGHHHHHHDHEHHHHHDHEHHHHHDHDHEHDHEHHHHDHGHRKGDETTASSRFGISSWVYERRRPFHVERLLALVRALIPRTPPKDKPLDHHLGSHILRSKGFVWLSYQPHQIFYWSHAHYRSVPHATPTNLSLSLSLSLSVFADACSQFRLDSGGRVVGCDPKGRVASRGGEEGGDFAGLFRPAR